jgi:sugar lactone lactonase YvrE
MKATQAILRILFVPLLMAAAGARADGVHFTRLWETGGLMNPESVVYDSGAGCLYVSNVNGDPSAKDGNGFISKVAMDGKLDTPQWVAGLNAPKGLAIYKGHLYVADIDTVIEIDLHTGAISARYQDTSAKFMNDVTAAEDGTIYVSDSGTNRIYRLRNGKLEVWLEDPQLDTPNGVHAEPGRVVVGTMGDYATRRPGQLLAVSLADKTISSLSGGKLVGVLDGVEADGDGGYFVTDWPAGKVLRVERSGAFQPVLDLSMGSADLTYLGSMHLMVVPLMQDSKLVAYRVEE